MFLIYSILYAFASAVLFVPQYLKRPRQARKKWVKEKFGLLDLPRTASRIWVHAVSVGEVNAAIPFIRKLKAAHPDMQVVLSTITDTGQDVAREKAPEGTSVVYLPFDLRFILKRCFKEVRPVLLIVFETELWPNLFRVSHEQQVPVIVLNGRISAKSSKGYRKISFFMKKVFEHVELFCMQSAVDAERIRAVGAGEKKVRVVGNFKFDIDITQDVPAWIKEMGGPVIVAGSTHKGEEEIIIDAYRENVYLFPGLKLIIAPRHPERFPEAEEVIRRSDIRYIKRSEFVGEGREMRDKRFNILLLDSVGELAMVYSSADIAIMGKSFEGSGGQNPLEPAFWSLPVICGPHMENFPFMEEFYAEGAAFEVAAGGLAKKIKELLMQPEKAKAAGQKAHALYLRNSGAVERALNSIARYVPSAGRGS